MLFLLKFKVEKELMTMVENTFKTSGGYIDISFFLNELYNIKFSLETIIIKLEEMENKNELQKNKYI